MPSKLQLKTLSTSGELLNVINCPAGRICVFRGSTPADLRPFQRALIGTHGKEKISVTVDGADYDPDKHNVIGLGEAPPHAGLTVREYLGRVGVADDALVGLLTSFGLEGSIDSKCSALSPDQERRVRMLHATSQPERALIVNEPFEHITSQWKERFAELLLDFVKGKNGLVVIPSLSYRPESWVDNALISRLEVGQSIQRTIGYGQAGSDANKMIEELRKQIQSEQPARPESRGQVAVAAAASAGYIPAGADGETPPSDMALIKSWLRSGESTWFKVTSSLIAAAIGVGGALTIVKLASSPESEQQTQVVASLQSTSAAPATQEKTKNSVDRALEDAKSEAQQAATSSLQQGRSEQPAARHILDEYPEVIRASIIDTTHGNAGELAEPEPQQQQAAPSSQSRSGNLYSLLEKAGSESAGPGPSEPAQVEEPSFAYQQPIDNNDAPVEQTEADAKREEIRSKFLEAIRSAAEQREASMEEE